MCNSVEFVEFANIQREDDEVLDVLRMFPQSLPVALLGGVYRQVTLNERTSLDTDTIISLIELCLKALQTCALPVVFWHSNGFAGVCHGCRSSDGGEWGEGPFNLFAISTILEEICGWHMCGILHSDLVYQFLDHLNNINLHIEFTFEIEKDRCLPFLDILLSRDPDCGVWTSVLHKSTCTGGYLHYSSHNPLSQKVSVLRTIFRRASSLSSSLVKHSVEE